MKRLAGLLCLILILSSAIAGAEDNQSGYNAVNTFSAIFTGTEDSFAASNAAEKYILQAFGFISGPKGSPLLRGTVELNGANRILYDALVELVQEVAEGQRTSTVCEIPMSEFGIQTSYTARELDVDSIFVGGQVPESTWDLFYSKIETAMNLDLNLVWNKLRSDHPYEMFWASNLHIIGGGYPSCSASSAGADGGIIFFPEGSVFSYPLYVIAEYSASKTEGTTQCDTDFGAAVADAVANAERIVAGNEGRSDREKLQAYKDEICTLASYNQAAADDPNNYYSQNPWQLVWALDGNPETQVVCEGYSKAFKALCDLSSFADASASIVTGTMSGGTGAGGHMWNLVKIQGKQYLVDVTNCDEGTVGYSDELFLAGYSALYNDGEGYIYRANGQDIVYVYDDEMYDLYAGEDLAVSDTPFEESAAPEVIGFSDYTLYHIESWEEGPIYLPAGDFIGYTLDIPLYVEDWSPIISAGIEWLSGDENLENLFRIEQNGQRWALCIDTYGGTGTAAYQLSATSESGTAARNITVTVEEMPEGTAPVQLENTVQVSANEALDLSSAGIVSNPAGYTEEYFVFDGNGEYSYAEHEYEDEDGKRFTLENGIFTAQEAGTYSAYINVRPGVNLIYYFDYTIEVEEDIDISTLTALVLPNDLIRIESQAFENGSFQAVIIPDNCTYIGAGAFRGCSNLVYISYPAGIEIEDDAFEGCNIRKTVER